MSSTESSHIVFHSDKRLGFWGAKSCASGQWVMVSI